MTEHDWGSAPGELLSGILTCVAVHSDEPASQALARCAQVCKSWAAALGAGGDPRPWMAALEKEFG